VLPTYLKIRPKSDVQIKITYFLRDPNEDLSKHKFRFEALAIKKDETQTDVKEIFKSHDANKDSKDKVYSMSRTVKLLIGKNKNNNYNNANNALSGLNNLSNQQNFNSQNNFNLLYVRN
jgi:hypothetical protein